MSKRKSFSDKVFSSLKNKVARLDRLKTVNRLISDTDSDFTRNRKLTFSDVIMIILSMTGCPIREELLDYFDYDINTATSSAFVQARAKVLPEAFEQLLHLFNNAYPCTETYKGYRLIAVDGSDLNIPYDPQDRTTLHKNQHKACSLYHINAAYDILNNRYADLIVQGNTNNYEQKAMWTMAERFPEKKTIFIADRNYPSWNNMEHIIRSGKYFLIRTKDIHSSSSLLRKFNLPDSEFDLDIKTTLTTKQTSDVRLHPEKYRFLSTSSTFDFFESDNPFYDVSYRVVRFKLDGGSEEYECIITNLPREEFSPAEIKELYYLRWQEEISFRHLKYSTNLSAVHARKRSSILQEIWARAILYNFSFVIIRELAKRRAKKKRKYEYVINKTMAIHLIRDLLMKRKGGSSPPDLEGLISNEILPLRPGRNDPRKVRAQSEFPSTIAFLKQLHYN
jgi:hypothetical protein